MTKNYFGYVVANATMLMEDTILFITTFHRNVVTLIKVLLDVSG